MMPQHHLPADIERTSMKIITGELAQRGLDIPPENAPVVKRVIHTTADFDYAQTLHFMRFHRPKQQKLHSAMSRFYWPRKGK